MSERLRREILEEIDREGPISFARYMELALYHPTDGFFATTPVGLRAHFVTSPHVSPVFGTLVAALLHDAWTLMEQPQPFDVIEAGAGDGTLARQVLHTATTDEAFNAALRYRAVEQGTAARNALANVGVEAFASLDEAAPFTGCIFANELLDNLPFRRVRGSAERVVGRDGDRLVLQDAPLPPDLATARSVPPWPDDVERTASPAAAAFVATCARTLERGYVALFDYGFTGDEDVEPVRGYRDQRLVDDVLAAPGETDVTGPVDFDAVAHAARANGLHAFPIASQRDALMRLGYRRVLDHLRGEQTRAEKDGDAKRALQLFGARNEAAMLVDPAGLGGLKLIVLATKGLPAPVALLD